MFNSTMAEVKGILDEISRERRKWKAMEEKRYQRRRQQIEDRHHHHRELRVSFQRKTSQQSVLLLQRNHHHQRRLGNLNRSNHKKVFANHLASVRSPPITGQLWVPVVVPVVAAAVPLHPHCRQPRHL